MPRINSKDKVRINQEEEAMENGSAKQPIRRESLRSNQLIARISWILLN